MSLLQEVTSIFADDATSWSSIVKLASYVEWDDWTIGRKNAAKIQNNIASLADEILAIADQHVLSVEHVAKNAIALANADNIPVAYLVVKKLFNDKKLSGDESFWFESFPSLTPFGEFLVGYVSGQFNPNLSVFGEILAVSIKTDAEENILRNALRCISPAFSSSSKLFREVLAVESLKQATLSKLIEAIGKETKDIDLKADLRLSDLHKFPVEWQKTILSKLDLSKRFLTASSLQKLSTKPQDIPETPQSLHNAQLVKELSTGLAKLEIGGKLLKYIFTSNGLTKKLDSDFDWSVLPNTDKQISLKFSEDVADNLKIFLHLSDFKTFSANLAAIVISSMPAHSGEELKRYEKTLHRLLILTERRVLYFSVKTARGDAQQFLINFIVREQNYLTYRKLAADAFFSNKFEDFNNIDSLILVLPLSDQKQRSWAFSQIFDMATSSLELLIKSDLYQTFYLERMKEGLIRKYCVSDDAFSTYDKLNILGADIVEALLENRTKIPKRPSSRFILSQVVRFSPALSGKIFSTRGIQLDIFKNILLFSNFKDMAAEAQIEIFKLRGARGKPALQHAIDKKLISKPFLKWVENQAHLKAMVIAHSPNSLPNYHASLAELLASTVGRPDNLALRISQASQAELILALPEALELLGEKSRVAAALELAVYSDISALPLFMRLVKRIAPPYSKESLGKRYDDLYVTYELPKRSGGTRLISAPAVVLKTAQRALLKLLYAEGFSDQAMGFVPGRSTRDNAAAHVGRNIVVNADIKGFFPSTGYKLVYSLSRKLCNESLSPLACRLFAEICCHNGHLATGAPTSPAVSNLILRGVDKALSGIAGKLDVSYTRYADDLTFSGDSASVWMLRPVIEHLRRLGYELDPKKTNIFRKGRRQTVTGAVVNEKVNLARPLRKVLRAAVDHRINGKEPFFQGKPMTDAALNGYLSYLKMLSPESAEPLLAKLREVPAWPY